MVLIRLLLVLRFYICELTTLKKKKSHFSATVLIEQCKLQHMWITRLPWPGSSDSKESAFHIGDPGWIPEWEDSLAKEIATTPVFLPGEFHGQRSLVSYSPWGCKKSDMTEWLKLYVTYICFVRPQKIKFKFKSIT